MNKKILIISGVYPPEKCGVSDYLYKIFNTVEGKNFDIYHDSDWSIRSTFKKIKKIKTYNSQVINLQYPTAAYLYSIVPHLLCIYFFLFTKKIVSITIHEYSQMGWKARITNFMFLIFSNKLIFTTQFELDYASRIFPVVKNKSIVIKIHSNIKEADIIPEIKDRKFDVGYFGLLRDNKGIEEFIEIVSNIRRKHHNMLIYIMGQTQPVHEQYQKEIYKWIEGLDIQLILNKTEDEVADILANTKIVYLPFPDGVSERRGSFLAAINNRSIVVTTKGSHTISAHNAVCVFADKSNAESVILETLNQNDEFYKSKQQMMNLFLLNNVNKSWEDISVNYSQFLLSK